MDKRPRVEVPRAEARTGFTMRVDVSPSNTLNGTLILPLVKGDDVADATLTGVPSQLRNQIARALQEGDFKGKKGEVLQLVGSEEEL